MNQHAVRSRRIDLSFAALLCPFLQGRADPVDHTHERGFPLPPKVTVVNLGTNGDSWRVGDGLFAFQVDEDVEDRDLNGDGDEADRFFRAYDVPSGTLTDLDTSLQAPGQNVLIRGRWVAFNSDADNRPYAFDADAGQIVGFGWEGEVEALGDGVVYVAAGEGVLDLNDDGDTLDRVLVALSVGTGIGTNLELAPGQHATFLAEGKSVVLGVSEANQGQADLNGDGDALDEVAFVFPSFRRPPVNLGLVFPRNDSSGHDPRLGFPLAAPILERGKLVFTVAEAAQGHTDLDGDGDADDDVLHLCDVRTGETRNLGWAGEVVAMAVDQLAVAVSEPRQGGADLNGDGDAADDVLFVHEFATESATNVRVALGDDSGIPSSALDRLFVGVSESGQGSTDLNGDGDTLDTVLHGYDFAKGVLANLALGIGSSSIQRQGDLVLFLVDEAEQGSSDLNQDGDSDDRVLHLLDIPCGAVKLVGLHGELLSDGTRIAVRLEERISDLNGDGDTLDLVWHLLAPRGTELLPLGLSGEVGGEFQVPVFAAGLFPLREREASRGLDLNGDGDAFDSVLHLVVLGSQD